jgi:alkylation response protein AidB-like acyl-CoA dehydrogenase
MTELPYERTIIGVAGVAAIERALRLTIDYTRDRKVFGQALIEMQNVRFVLADIKTEATIARTFIDRCIVDLIEGRMDTVLASMAKCWISDLQCSVVALRAVVRRLRLHARISDCADVCRCECPSSKLCSQLIKVTAQL